MTKIATTKNIERTDTMTKTKTTKTEEPVSHVEQLQLGAPCAEPLRVAEAAIAADRATAEAELFPRDIRPVTADTLAQYQWLTGRLGASGYVERMADLHSRAMASHPELAQLLRSPDVLDDIGAAAAALARDADRDRARYQLAIARQVAGVPGHELVAAAITLLAAEVLANRLAAARARHEEHERVSAERAEAERREAERAAEAEAEREAVERETSAKLAGLCSGEQDRLIAVAKLRHRLSKTPAPSIRVAGHLYRTSDLVFAVSAFTVQRCAEYQAAIDTAEAEARQ
jgi:hypothetical protein